MRIAPPLAVSLGLFLLGLSPATPLRGDDPYAVRLDEGKVTFGSRTFSLPMTRWQLESVYGPAPRQIDLKNSTLHIAIWEKIGVTALVDSAKDDRAEQLTFYLDPTGEWSRGHPFPGTLTLRGEAVGKKTDIDDLTTNKFEPVEGVPGTLRSRLFYVKTSKSTPPGICKVWWALKTDR